MNEKLTSLEQLRMAAERSAQRSAQVALAAADAIEELSARAVTEEALVEKQDRLTGTQGQVVGFDEAGNAVAQDGPSGGAAPIESPVFTGAISMGRKSETIVGDASVALGYKITASGTNSHAEGSGSTASGDYSHAEGYYAKADGHASHAEGNSTKAIGNAAHVEGGAGTTASGDYSHAEGLRTTASGTSSHAEGVLSTASGNKSHAEGDGTASGYASHAEGSGTTASGNYSHAGGEYTVAEYQSETAIGRYNVRKSPNNATTLNDLFVVGKGTAESAQANAFRVDHTGVYGTGAFNASGADYAELFEWLDGNPDSEDRAGLFVTLDGERIRIAGPDDDYILGIVSATPSVVGDVYDDQWQGMEVRDVFGRTVMEMQDIPSEIGPGGEEIAPARRELAPKLNPDYDHTVKYRPRTQRPEWAAVGLLGKLVAVDDGSCQVNGWAAVGEGGQATASAARSKYRVMARLDDTHIRLMIL